MEERVIHSATETVDALEEYFSEEDGLDLTNYREVMAEIKANPLAFAEMVVKKMEREIKRVVEGNDLCPECFGKLKPCGFVNELMGECHGAPAYQKQPTRMGCEDCHYSEEI